MARTLSIIFTVSLIAVLSSAADPPPNLGKTLATQQEIVADRPYDATAHNDLGNLLVLDGRYPEAQDAYRRAIELESVSVLPRFNLAVLLQQTGRWRDAVAEFHQLLEIEERHGRAHYQLGMLFESRKKRSTALKHYAMAFAYEPDLTFAAINPHILDNSLRTEALLMAGKYRDSASADTPRLYGEGRRIANLMLEEEEPEVTPEDEPRSELPVEAVREAGSHQAPAEETDEGRDQREPEESASDPEEEAGTGRSLTIDDLDQNSTLGQVTGSSSRRRPAIGGATRSRSSGKKSSLSVQRQGQDGKVGASAGRKPGSQDQPTSFKRPRYRPSRGSTGRLELKLLPAAEEERYAALGLPRGK